MTSALVLGVGGVYVLIGVGYLRDGHPGLGMAFLAYAAANLGLFIEGRS